MKGNRNAPVAILEYADFECPACQQFVRQSYQSLIAKYVDTGRARFAYKHFPLPNHPLAQPAAIASECAGEQGQFWGFYQSAFHRAKKLTQAGLEEVGKGLGLDRRRWNECRKTEKQAEMIQEHLDEAMRLEFRGTPTFLIGTLDGAGKLRSTSILYGARPLSDFDTAIAQAEKAASSTR